jgi:hypothetical protein
MIYSKNVRIIGGEGQESTAAILSRTQTGLDSLPTIYQSPLIFVFEIDPQRLALSDFPLLSYQIISFLMRELFAFFFEISALLKIISKLFPYSYVVDSKSCVVLVLLIVLANLSSLEAFDPPKERNKTSTREKMTSVLVQNICFACECEKVVLSLERGFYRMVKNTKLQKNEQCD